MTSPSVDIAGTGGDGTGAMNISTLAGIVAAGAGCTVVKHGGRAASSITAGSADLIEALGIDLDPHTNGLGVHSGRGQFTYLFAPLFNPGLRHAIDARWGLGIPTVFNLAAPLINPARPDQQVVGVADAGHLELIAQTLQRLGRSGLVIRGHDGLDKLTTTATSDVYIVRQQSLLHLNLDPTSLGLKRASLQDLQGGPASENAERAQALLHGEKSPLRDVVVLNAAAVITAGELSVGTAIEQLRAAIQLAEQSVDSGAAWGCLHPARSRR